MVGTRQNESTWHDRSLDCMDIDMHLYACMDCMNNGIDYMDIDMNVLNLLVFGLSFINSKRRGYNILICLYRCS